MPLAMPPTSVSTDGVQLIIYIGYLTDQHPNALAVVLHPDTLEILRTWAKNNVRMVEQTRETIFGKTIITSEDLSVGTVLIAY